METASKGKFVIPIQTEGNNVPMFGIPEFLLYSKIGKHINKNQPFYSIENFPYETSTEIVNHYITQIKTVHPHGPYGLMGYCGWGDVILEMARILIAQGDEVPVLVLVEYYSPSIALPKTSSEFIRQKVKYMINTLRKNDSIVNKRNFLFEHFLFLLKFIKRKFFGTGKKTSVPANKTYRGKVILIQASETYGFKDDSHMGWGDVFTGEVKKFIIEGEHGNIMFNSSEAKQIAEILRTNL
ncbi:MAG: thioesterase domain-containing protein [Chitinophagaceae bacterium]